MRADSALLCSTRRMALAPSNLLRGTGVSKTAWSKRETAGKRSRLQPSDRACAPACDARVKKGSREARTASRAERPLVSSLKSNYTQYKLYYKVVGPGGAREPQNPLSVDYKLRGVAYSELIVAL